MSIRLGATKDTILCALSPKIEEGRDGTIKHMPRILHSECVGRGFPRWFFAHVRSRRLKASRLRRLRRSRLVEQNDSIVPSPPEILSLQMILQSFLKSAAPSRCKRMQTHAGLLRRLPHQASNQSSEHEFPADVFSKNPWTKRNSTGNSISKRISKEFPNPWKPLLCNLEACMHDRILSAKKILSFFSFHL